MLLNMENLVLLILLCSFLIVLKIILAAVPPTISIYKKKLSHMKQNPYFFIFVFFNFLRG